jgi:hypothetical protein
MHVIVAVRLKMRSKDGNRFKCFSGNVLYPYLALGENEDSMWRDIYNGAISNGECMPEQAAERADYMIYSWNNFRDKQCRKMK